MIAGAIAAVVFVGVLIGLIGVPMFRARRADRLFDERTKDRLWRQKGPARARAKRPR